MGTHESQETADTVRGAHEAPEVEEPTGRTIAGVLGSPRFWLAPLILVAVLFSLMAALYMSAVVDPQRHLHDFPIALVNEDSGGEVTGADGKATEQNIGDQVADGIISSAADNGIVVRRTDRSTALGELNSGKVYGVVIIGSNFTNRAVALGRSTVLPAQPTRPAIDIFINRGSGAFASSITTTATACRRSTRRCAISSTATTSRSPVPLSSRWRVRSRSRCRSRRRCRRAPETDCRRSTSRCSWCWPASPAR